MLKNLHTAEKLLHALREQPRLTTLQLVKLIEPTAIIQRGNLSSSKEYHRVAKALKRLEQDKLIESVRLGDYTFAYWYPKGERQPNKFTESHDRLIGDLYVALASSVEDWSSEKQKAFRYDARCVINGRIVYFELETGSQAYTEKVEDKLKRYVKHYNETREPFHLIFCLQDYQPNPLRPVRVTAREYGFQIFEMMKGLELGENYLITVTPKLLENPLQTPLVSRFKNSFTLQNLP